MASSLVTELQQLAISGVDKGKGKGKKLLWGRDYDVSLQPQSDQAQNQGQDGPSNTLHLTSWHMQDYVYKQDPCPYPTRARGLFTTQDRIVVRGYDKFFNVNEVSWTKVRSFTDFQHFMNLMCPFTVAPNR